MKIVYTIFSAGVTYMPSLVSFGVRLGSEKCDSLGQKSRLYKNNMDNAGQDLLGPL